MKAGNGLAKPVRAIATGRNDIGLIIAGETVFNFGDSFSGAGGENIECIGTTISTGNYVFARVGRTIRSGHRDHK